MIRLLGQLHAADALLCDVPPDSLEVFRRHEQATSAVPRKLLRPPFAWLPLFDPDRFLARTAAAAAAVLGWILLWLAVVGTAVVLAGPTGPT